MQITEFVLKHEARDIVRIRVGEPFTGDHVEILGDYSSLDTTALEDRLLYERRPVLLSYNPLSPEIVQVLVRLNWERINHVRLFIEAYSGGGRIDYVKVDNGAVLHSIDQMTHAEGLR